MNLEISLFNSDSCCNGISTGSAWNKYRYRGRMFILTEWKTETELDDGVPQPPRFNPKRTPGVQPPLNMGNPPPGEIFSHFFDAAVFKLLCENTNKNAAKNLEKGTKFIWTEINPDEMKKFVGMLLYMAVLKLPRISDFWRQQKIFHVPFPATVMSRDRFMAVLSNLHLSDPEQNEDNDKKKGTEDYDHLHRFRPLMEIICVNCKAIYHPRQHLAVDERMVGTKARLSIKQYMKAKPTKWGLKFFVLADMNGYTIDFILYTGKSKWASGKGLSFDVVAGLVNNLGSGYIIYTDNFYTSPLLFRHLRQQGFGACGTYRVGVPTTQDNALTKKSPRGSIRWIRDRDLLFVKWMDVREVSLCSTIHPVYSGDTVERWSKTGDGPQQKISFPRPTSVTEYNKYMGGVDTSDQMIGTNTVHRKTRRWPTTVFQHLLDIAVTNSFVIHKSRCRFQEELTAHLFGVDLKTGPEKTPGTKHLPVPTSSGHSKSDTASMGRRRCKLCKKSTAWQCQECGVGLCLQPERNCFWQHHQDV
uniref:PiggyBac transposable element-derived protein domain-containing protein n=1 Tax=Seriola dumerili TaxID=41447 RepID=A0A3B4T981_SERDU